MKIATRIPLWDAPFQNAIMGRREAASCALRGACGNERDAELRVCQDLKVGLLSPDGIIGLNLSNSQLGGYACLWMGKQPSAVS
jgi:hypothetical protein